MPAVDCLPRMYEVLAQTSGFPSILKPNQKSHQFLNTNFQLYSLQRLSFQPQIGDFNLDEEISNALITEAYKVMGYII